MADNKMRGQLRIASDLEGKARVAHNPFDLPSSGAGEAAQSIAGGLATLGREIGAYADHAAAVEGARAGTQAGLDPEFRPTRDISIRGEAFDRAGLQVYETTAKIEIENDIAQAAQASGEDAGAFAGRMGQIKQHWLSKVPEEMRPEVTHMFRRSELTYNRQAKRASVARFEAETREALNAEVETGIKGLHQRAYALGLDADADKVLGEDFSALAKTLQRPGLDGKPLMEPATAGKIMRQAQEAVVDARLLGAFDRLPGSAEKEAFAQKFEDDFAKSEGLARFYDFKGFQRMSGEFHSLLVSDRAERRQRVAAVTESLKDMQTAAEKGYTPTPDQVAGLKARAEAVGEPALSERVALLEDVTNVQVAARKSPPAAIEAAADGLRAQIRDKGPSEASVARVEMLDKLAGEARRELATDPLGWAERSQYTKVAPLDFDNFEASLKARIVQAEDVAGHYQLPETRYLRPEETRQLAAFAAQGGDRMLQIAGDITRIAGPRAKDMLREVWKEAPLVATLGGHVADVGVTSVARDVAAGVALRQAATAEKIDFKSVAPSADDTRGWARNEHAGALSGLAATEQAFIAATNAAYEVRARAPGATPGETLWRKTFREMIGERSLNGETYGGIALTRPGTLWGGSGAVVVPANVKNSGFRDLIAEIGPEDFGSSPPRYGDNSPVTAADLKRAQLMPAGDGRYFLNMGDADAPRLLRDAQGGPFVLDIKALEPKLKQRRGDLYFGGK